MYSNFILRFKGISLDNLVQNNTSYLILDAILKITSFVTIIKKTSESKTIFLISHNFDAL